MAQDRYDRARGTPDEPFPEVEHDFPGLGRRVMLPNARRLERSDEM